MSQTAQRASAADPREGVDGWMTRLGPKLRSLRKSGT